ncbi:MAG: RdgB/HAM1 family non-canonical purine NTP pyrophosphatase [Gammaproteobacteria bacterium]|nr:RdgB/HAM1 family non-canonical purine NTP pyrophosphatase [Gammaproteobacteria bacterium]
MNRGTRWVLASSNEGKRRELAALLAPLGIELVTQRELGLAEADETACSFVENALLKARAAAASGLPALADDSGLVVAGLHGAPGVRSARYAGPNADDAANIAHLLDALHALPDEARLAHFVCVLVALRSVDDPDPLIARGTWAGRIARAPRGHRGFGYDPVFEVPALGLTAAELPPEQKNAISHRGQALAALGRLLASR